MEKKYNANLPLDGPRIEETPGLGYFGFSFPRPYQHEDSCSYAMYLEAKSSLYHEIEKCPPKKREKLNSSGTGNRTLSCRVRDGDVDHYTIPDKEICHIPPLAHTSGSARKAQLYYY